MDGREITALRRQLKKAGFHPLPLTGKRPAMDQWSKKTDTNFAEIGLWEKVYPWSENTGILTQSAPAIDIDILDDAAAAAVEELARDMFEDRGYFLVRFGRAPKRAILLRTDLPFKKLATSLISPEGKTDQKVEILGDGQQIAVFGIHPDTGKPYSWHGGEPGKISWDELPYVSVSDVKEFLDRAADLLVKEFGFSKPVELNEQKEFNGEFHHANWAQLVANVIGGIELHDSLRDLAASFIGNGVSADICTRMLQAMLIASNVPHDERWKARFDEVTRSVSSAIHKFKKNDSSDSSRDFLLQSSSDFIKDFVPPDYLIERLLQRRFLYSFTGKTGSGKTAVVLFIAAAVALGRPIGDLQAYKGRVLYLAGENPDDVRMRWIAMSQQMDFDIESIPVYFVPGRFKISEMRARIVDELQRIGEIALVIVDTSAAYFEGNEVNSNTQQGQHARMMRTLVGLPGGPCVVVNCHPVKNAASDNLLPLGAGAFLNEVDGNLTCAIENPAIEVHWQGKIRGPDFEPLSFEVETVKHDKLKDSRGEAIPTVVARHLSDGAKEEMKKASLNNADRVLAEIDDSGNKSIADYAAKLGWLLANGRPHKTKVHRAISKLKAAKYVTMELDSYSVTEKGKKRLKSLGTVGSDS